MGEDGGAGEVDETLHWPPAGRHQEAALARVIRTWSFRCLIATTGQVRSFHVASATLDGGDNPSFVPNISKEAHLMTDQAKLYQKVGTEFAP